MKIKNLDFKKKFKNKLFFADNFEKFNEVVNNNYSFSIINDNGDYLDFARYDGKLYAYNYDGDPILECDTLDELVLVKFDDGMTVFEFLTGEKPIIEE